MGTNSELMACIASVFSADGLLVRSGYRHEPSQEEYALSIGRHLDDESGCGKVSLAEAETGLGKTIAYLIPVMIKSALARKDGRRFRSLISTYTRALQRQILQSDINVASEMLSQLGLTATAPAIRIGKDNYWSPARVNQQIKMLSAGASPSRVEALLDFEARIRAWCVSGSGLIQDWIDENGALPFELTCGDVCLLRTEADDDNPAFQRDRGAVGSSDLVITNHASAILMAKGYVWREQSSPWDCIIVDEGHLFEKAAEDHETFRIQTRELTSLVARIASSYPKLTGRGRLKRMAESAGSIAMRIDDIGDQSPGQSWALPPIEEGNELRTEVLSLANHLNVIAKEIMGLNEVLEAEDAKVYMKLEGVSGGLRKWLSGPSQYIDSVIMFSEKKRLGSLGVHPVRPGSIIHKLMNEQSRLIVTSATLAVPKATGLCFNQARGGLLFSADRVYQAVSLGPRDYGDVEFHCMSRDVPKPVIMASANDDGEDRSALNPAWLRSAAEMISEAAQLGPTMVLTLSYTEAAELGKVLLPGSKQIFVHERTGSLDDLISSFIAAGDGIIITPAAWEGVSIRREDGAQLITQLVVAHIPFMSLDNEEMELFLRRTQKNGLPNSASTAASFFMSIKRRETVNKLRQGFGRLIRSPSDKGNIWIADPRFPRPEYGDSTHGYLLRCIPSRFETRFGFAKNFIPSQYRKAPSPERSVRVII